MFLIKSLKNQRIYYLFEHIFSVAIQISRQVLAIRIRNLHLLKINVFHWFPPLFILYRNLLSHETFICTIFILRCYAPAGYHPELATIPTPASGSIIPAAGPREGGVPYSSSPHLTFSYASPCTLQLQILQIHGSGS